MDRRLRNRAFKIFLAVVTVPLTLVAVEIVCGWLIQAKILYPRGHFDPHILTRDHALLPYEIPVDYGWIESHFERPPEVLIPPTLPRNIDVIDDYADPFARSLKLIKNYTSRTSASFRVLNRTHVVYDITITADEFARRPSRPKNSQRNSPEHLLLLGCSYTFGHGLNEEDTLSWQINEMQSKFEAYNNGFGGYGPNDTLWRFREGDFLAGISQRKGVAIYTFIAPQFFRAIYSTFNSPWGQNLSAFEESGNSLRFVGDFRTARPYTTDLYNYLATTKTFAFFQLTLPILRHYHYDYVARLIAAIRDEYLNRTDLKNQFVVSIYPEFIKKIDIVLFREALSRQKIHFIDYSNMSTSQYSSAPTRISYDGHPNRASQAIYAQWLLHDLKLKGTDTLLVPRRDSKSVSVPFSTF